VAQGSNRNSYLNRTQCWALPIHVHHAKVKRRPLFCHPEAERRDLRFTLVEKRTLCCYRDRIDTGEQSRRDG
jgi:hypothetical protein